MNFLTNPMYNKREIPVYPTFNIYKILKNWFCWDYATKPILWLYNLPKNLLTIGNIRDWEFFRTLKCCHFSLKNISSISLLNLCRDELRHRNPIRKPLFMRFCELSVSILPTVCPQEFFAHRLSLHLFYGLIIAYFVE